MKRTLVFVFLLAFLTMFTSCDELLSGNSGSAAPIYSIDDSTKVARLAEIKSYSPDSTGVPSDYFTYFGFRDWYRWPLVYPYSINSVDSRDDGFILIEKGFDFVEGKQNDMDQVQGFGSIKEIAFNDKVLITRTQDSNVDKFEMFVFSNQEMRSFNSFKSMKKAALEFGIEASDTLISLEEYSLFYN